MSSPYTVYDFNIKNELYEQIIHAEKTFFYLSSNTNNKYG